MTLSPAELKAFGVTIPPTQAELPYDDGEPMESQRHQFQMELLIETLLPWLDEREDGYVGGNMFVYYSLMQVKNQDFKGPDFFAVLGVPKGERKSWVCWEEGKTPDVIIELLSESTATTDKGAKKLVYQNQLHVPEYFWYDPFNAEDWAGFRLQGGSYDPIAPSATEQLAVAQFDTEQLVSQVLDLALVRWPGTLKGIEATWLRWADLSGTLLPTPEEKERQRTGQERQRTEQERQRAEQERQRAEQAEAQVRQIGQNLLQAGMSVEQVAQMTGLAIAQVQRIQHP